MRTPHGRAREENGPSRRAASFGRHAGGAHAAVMMMAPVALIAALLAPGCGSPMRVQMEGTMRMEGPLLLSEGSYVSDDMFDSLEEGSHKSWAIALFGEPDQRTTLEDGSEVWRWTFQQTVMDIALDPSLLKVGGGDDKKSGKDAGSGSEQEPAAAGRSGKIVITNTYVHIMKDHVEAKWRG